MESNPATFATIIRSWTKNLLIAIAFASATEALAGPGGTDRPHLGTCDAVVTPLTTDFPLQLRIDLACQFRHLGRTTGLAMQEVNPAGPLVDGVLPIAIAADITYVAANGDSLLSTFAGVGTIDFVTGAVAFEGVETYDGGTNRFAQASGRSFIEGHASIVTNTGFYVTVGRLSY